jgi:trehalose 6-phosphate synthase/phosphatase
VSSSSVIGDGYRSGPLTLLLDYDGTLVPIAPTPDLAVPDVELLNLLATVSKRAELVLHIVSGRPRDILDAWFSKLPASLWAEHGFWHRLAPGLAWVAAGDIPTEALRAIRPLFDLAAATTTGSFVEEKSASLAWHYRQADLQNGEEAALALRATLDGALGGTPLERLDGNKVIEVRPRGISKALVARHVWAERVADTAVVAIGDDITDGELFEALPDSAITIAVGQGATGAKYHVIDHHDARDLLRALVL